MNVTAIAQRSGNWWAVEVPEVPGVFTQARRLDQVESMVRDAVALMEDVPEADINVDVVPVLGDEVAGALSQAQADRAEAQALSDRASANLRAVARTLSEAAFSLRDIGMVLDLSHQRVAQLLEPVGPRSLKEHGEAAPRAAAQGGGKSVRRAESAGVSAKRVGRAIETQRKGANRGAGVAAAAAPKGTSSAPRTAAAKSSEGGRVRKAAKASPTKKA